MSDFIPWLFVAPLWVMTVVGVICALVDVRRTIIDSGETLHRREMERLDKRIELEKARSWRRL